MRANLPCAEIMHRLNGDNVMLGKRTIIQQQFAETVLALSLLELSRGLTCIADGVMTSRLVGTDELAAFGITAPYYSIVAIISIFLTISCQTMYTQNLGKARLDRANAYLSYAVLYGDIISIALTVLGIVFSGPLCFLFGARGESAFLMPYAKEYLIGLLIGTAGNVMLGILTPIVELDGGGVWSKSADFVMVVVNIAGNYITTRVLGLGLLGIGISSSLGFYAAVLVLCIHFFTKKCQIRFSVNKENRIGLGEYIRIGYPGAVSMLCRAICPIFVNGTIIAVASSVGLSAVSAQANIKFMIGAPLCGIAGAVMELGSISYGERDSASLREILSISSKYILFGVVPFAIAVFAAAPLFSGFYFSKGTEVFPLAAEAIRWYAVSLPFVAFNMAAISYFQVIEKRVTLLVMYVFNELLSVALFTAVLGGIFGLSGIWAAIAVGPAAISAVCIVKFFAGRKKGSKNSLPGLPPDFGVPAENCLYVTVRTIDEVMEFSRDAQSFCTQRGIAAKKAVSAAVLIEELAVNVVKHGFADGKKHQVDMRIVVDSDNVILKIADDCKRFDFNRQASALRISGDEVDKNLGLKLALGLTHDITYVNTANKNVLVMTI